MPLHMSGQGCFCIHIALVIIVLAMKQDQCLSYDLEYKKLCVGPSTPPKVDGNIERTVLIEFYNKTQGETWRVSWDFSQHHCQWYGITCLYEAVCKITLAHTNLNGTLPNSLWRLQYLQILSLHDNPALTGYLSDVLDRRMESLLYLDLSSCNFKGNVPSSLASLSNLKRISLGNNRLQGKIPANLGQLGDLMLLDLIGQSLSGEVPESFGNLTQLQFLGLSGNTNLTGRRLGYWINNLKNLEYLDLGDIALDEKLDIFQNFSFLEKLYIPNAHLRGKIPENMPKMFPKIRELFLPGNDLQGEIPTSLRNMSSLTQLSLANNKVVGEINSILEAPSLSLLDLSHNKLTCINSSAFNNAKLEILLLNDNPEMTGSLGELLGATSTDSAAMELRVLNISNCNFSGPIPVTLWNLENLVYLDLSNNRLTDALPRLPGPLHALLVIDVSQNNLTGAIPDTYSKMYSLQILDVSGNLDMRSTNLNENKTTSKRAFLQVDYSNMERKATWKFSCPNMLTTTNNGVVMLDPRYYGYEYCICDNGYYGAHNYCRKCMQGGECKKTGDREHNSTRRTMKIHKGYYPVPSPENATHLEECESSVGVLVGREKHGCNPSGQCTCSYGVVSPGDKPVTSCDTTCLCKKGSYDRLCSRCQSGWYRFGGICHRCPSNSTSLYITIGVLICSMFVFFVAFFCLRSRKLLGTMLFTGQIIMLLLLRCFEVIPGWLLEVNFIVFLFCLIGVGHITKGLMKIALFYFQILDVLVSANYTLWPNAVLKIQHYVSTIVNFNFPGFSCEMPQFFTPILKFALILVLPIVFTIVFALVYLFFGLLFRLGCKVNLVKVKCHCRYLVVAALSLMYFPLVHRTVAVLAACPRDQYMRMSPWLPCEGTEHHTLQILGWISVVVYIIGIPLFIFLPLLVYYTRKQKKSILSANEQQILDTWLGSIFLPYKPQFHSFYEVYVLMRKLLIAFTMGYIAEKSSFQTFAVSFLLCLALVIHLVLWPYRSTVSRFPIENTAETIVLFVLQHSFILLRFTASQNHFPDKEGAQWTIVGVNGLLVIVFVVSILVAFARPMTSHLSRRTRALTVPFQDNSDILYDSEDSEEMK